MTRNEKRGLSPIVFVDSLINLGTKSGMPRYTAILALLQASILFIPESSYSALGFNASTIKDLCPAFTHYYINNSHFKNAMTVFWLVAPLISAVSTVISIWHFNVLDYKTYIERRIGRLEKAGKDHDYSLIIGVLVFFIFYVWGTAIYQVEPTLWGSFTPTNNRFSMLLIHGGAFGLLFPFGTTLLITEIRASIFDNYI